MKFKNSTGQYYTRGLFFELSEDKTSVVYTLKHEDHLGYPSLYRLYMETSDATEYEFAKNHLDGWEHWLRISEASWFKETAAEWRAELEVKLQSEHLRKIEAIARSEGREALAAARVALEWSRKTAGKSKAGRPTKAAIKEEAHQIALEQDVIRDHYNLLVQEKPN